MQRGAFDQDGEMLTALKGVSRRTATELYNIYIYCGYKSFAVDPSDTESLNGCVDFAIFTDGCSDELLTYLGECGTTVVILRKGRWSREWLTKIVENHRSTTVLRRGYLMIFNNHLPKQHFTL